MPDRVSAVCHWCEVVAGTARKPVCARRVKWSSSRSQARASSVVLRLCARGLAALTLACYNGVPGLRCFLSTHVANRPVASSPAHGKADSIMPDVAGSAVASGTC